MNPRPREGFTLIELLIVVVIIGVLASIAIPKFSRVRERSYIAAVTADLKNLASQQEIYQSNNQVYAASVGQLTAYTPTEGVVLTVNQSNGTGWAATGYHAALTGRLCGMYFGSASAANATPATLPGQVACQN